MSLHSEGELLTYAIPLARIEDALRAYFNDEIGETTFIESVAYFVGYDV